MTKNPNAPCLQNYNLVKTFGGGAPAKAEVAGFDRPTPFTPAIDSQYEFRNEILTDVFGWWLMGEGEGLFLTGPSGSGKSSLIRQVCARLCLPMQHLVGHARLEFPEMVSTIHITNGNTRVSYGPLARAMKYGHVFLLDEVDLIDPSTNAALNEVIQGKPLTVPETGEVIQPHPMFKFIATGNTRGGQDHHGLYQGTVGQNLAFMDRFWTVEVGYPAMETELRILKQAASLPEEILRSMIEVAHGVRDAFMGENDEAHSCELTFSTRTLLRWSKAMAYFGPMGKKTGIDPIVYSLEKALTNRANPETKRFIHELTQRVFGA
jgi:cobaltochelatase CobS